MNIFINYFNCQTVMFPIFYFIVFSTISCSESKPFPINNCCPKGQNVFIDKDEDYKISCRPTRFADYPKSFNNTVEHFDSFPIHLIVNAKTLKIHENHSDKHWKILRENYEIREGFFPNCTFEETGFGVDADGTSDFYFILYDNKTLKFHISKDYSKHKIEHGLVNVERVSDMEAEIAPDAEKITTFPLSEACFDFRPNITTIVYCRCLHNICIKKCCEDERFLNVSREGRTCEPMDRAKSLEKINDWRPKTEGIIDNYYVIENSRPNCSLIPLKDTRTCSAKYYSESDNKFEILPNGSIKIKRYKQLFSTEEYCGETTWYEDDEVMFEQNLFLCLQLEQNAEEPSNERLIIYGTLLIFGGICLVVTVSISIYLPELRKKMHNKIALSHNFSLMVACFVAGISQLHKVEIEEGSCIFLASLTQFSFLGSFFWLNVMCIDISLTFSATRSVGAGSTSNEHKKFLYYSIYAWGSTATITILTIVMETLPRVIHYDLRPGFSCHCGFNTETSAIFIYFYGPMALILATNLILFIFTTLKIMAIQRQTAILHKTDFCATRKASYQSDKQRLILYAKLFLLMGLSWVTEILSWAIGGPEQYWYFTDGINLFRAVFIFILFICKRPVLKSLKEKLSEDLSFSTLSRSDSLKNSKDTFRLTYSARVRKLKPSVSNSSKKSLTQASKEN